MIAFEFMNKIEILDKKLSISVDMDALEDYARFYRVPCHINSSRFHNEVIPRFLKIFDELGIKATFFVIGRDAQVPEVIPLLQEIVHRGHEISNHSMTHENKFSSLSFDEKEKEITEANKTIEDAIGQKVVGFRAPAYDFDDDILRILIDNGFKYDSSINPTLMKPVIKLLSMWWAKKISVGQGKLRHCFYNTNPHFLTASNGIKLLELPISVVPGVRFPFFGTMMMKLGRKVFENCLMRINKKGVPYVVYELHGIELFDFTKIHGLDDFKILPGFMMDLEEKSAFLRYTLSKLLDQREPMTILKYSSSINRT